MSYSRDEIKLKANDALNNPATLYAQPFVNYKGGVNGERYTEIVAREISRRVKSDNLAAFRHGIKMITREESYKTASHFELAKQERPAGSNRGEEWIAKEMFGKSFDYIGEVIDFQIPLNNTSNDGAGKIDLLSYNISENTAYILELKKPASEETLLRCVLEVFTYWKIVDKEKLMRDFDIVGAELRKAVLVYENSVAYKDFQDDECEAVYTLMCDKLHVDLFVLGSGGERVIDGYRH